MVNQVGRPAMLEGKRFLPLTGMPILKMARNSEVFAVWLPEPFTVATTMEKLLTPDALSSISPASVLGETPTAMIGPTLSAGGRALPARPMNRAWRRALPAGRFAPKQRREATRQARQRRASSARCGGWEG